LEGEGSNEHIEFKEVKCRIAGLKIIFNSGRLKWKYHAYIATTNLGDINIPSTGSFQLALTVILHLLGYELFLEIMLFEWKNSKENVMHSMAVVKSFVETENLNMCTYAAVYNSRDR